MNSVQEDAREIKLSQEVIFKQTLEEKSYKINELEMENRKLKANLARILKTHPALLDKIEISDPDESIIEDMYSIFSNKK